MYSIRFKVLQKFPFWRIQDDDVKLGMVFEVITLDNRWSEIGGAYFLVDFLDGLELYPDFSGARLAYLEEHHYIQRL